MNEEQYRNLVRRIEERATKNPARYHRRVVALALLGSAYYGFLVMLSVALLVGIVLLMVTGNFNFLIAKIAFVVCWYVWAFVKSSWIKFQPPNGERISRADAPALFDMIDQLVLTLNTKKLEGIYITNVLNAGVMSIPRLGPLGWQKHYLLIGLPVMYVWNVEQFRSVLAHELGHLRKGHTSTANWVYRQRIRWSQLLEVLEKNESVGLIFVRPFLRWYRPYFSAYSFPLARAQEYEADAVAAQLTSVTSMAQALSNLEVAVPLLSKRFWPGVFSRATLASSDEAHPFTEMAPQVVHFSEPATVSFWIDKALQEKASTEDTHPSFSERLKALGQHAQFCPPTLGSQSANLLAPSLARLQQKFDSQWQEVNASYLKGARQERENFVARYEQLNATMESGEELSDKEAIEFAYLAERLNAQPENMPALWESLHQRLPNDSYLALKWGACLLGGPSTEQGIELIEKAMRKDPSHLSELGSRMLLQHFEQQYALAEANFWESKLREASTVAAMAEIERETIEPSDTFIPHTLEPEELQKLKTALSGIAHVAGAYLVQKKCVYHPDRSLLVLGVVTAKWYHLRTRRKAVEVSKQCAQVSFTEAAVIVVLDFSKPALRKKITKLTTDLLHTDPWALRVAAMLRRLLGGKR